MGSAFVAHLILTRILGTEQYGIFALVTAWLMLLVMVSKLGQQTALVRFVASYRAGQQWGLMKGIRRFTRVTTLMMGLAITAIGLFGLLSVSHVDPSIKNTALVACLVFRCLP